MVLRTNLGIGIGGKVFFTLVLSLLFFNCSGSKVKDFTVLDSVIEKGIKSEIMPGAVVFVGTSNGIVYKKAYGFHTYNKNSKKVEIDEIFDLASVSKVLGTTSVIMKLYEEGKISISNNAMNYLPGFEVNGKEDITIENLLHHNSGLQPYYRPQPGEKGDSLISILKNLNKEYPTGEKMVYSCLNFISLMKISENITGERFDNQFYKIITEPMGLKRTFYTPDSVYYNSIMPTEDSLVGMVHDPFAAGLDGISGNAGLFSTGEDISQICMMYLNKGNYKGKQIFKKETIEKFTSHSSNISSRALGWDTNIEGGKSCGVMFSKSSFGHTGYTGTSVWIDPQNDFFVVFLTNRVYPDDKASVGQLRKEVHNASFRVMKDIPESPKVEYFINKEDELAFSIKTNNRGSYDSTVVYLEDDTKRLIKHFVTDLETITEKIKVPSGKYSLFSYNYLNGNKSIMSDIYVSSKNENKEFKKILFIDAIDTEPSTDYKSNFTFQRISSGINNFIYETVEAKQLGVFKEINNYDFYFWLTGEDNSEAETIDKNDRKFISDWIDLGKTIVISGSEIAWAIDRDISSKEGRKFLTEKVGVFYQADKSSNNQLYSINNFLPDEFEIEIGNKNALYFPYYPDVIKTNENGKSIFNYSENESGAALILYKTKAKVFFFAFPLETINEDKKLNNIVNKIIMQN